MKREKIGNATNKEANISINKVWDLKDIVKEGEISEKHIYEINGLIKKNTNFVKWVAQAI